MRPGFHGVLSQAPSPLTRTAAVHRRVLGRGLGAPAREPVKLPADLAGAGLGRLGELGTRAAALSPAACPSWTAFWPAVWAVFRTAGCSATLRLTVLICS